MIFQTSIQVRFADIDKLGHANNAKYLTYCEQARMDVFDKLFGRDGIDWSMNGFILARAEVDFIAPVYMDDVLVVETTCSRIGTKSLDFNYRLFTMNGEKRIPVAESVSVLVAYNYDKNHSMPIPPEWRAKLESILQTEE